MFFTFNACSPDKKVLVKQSQKLDPNVQITANLTIRSSFITLMRFHLQKIRYLMIVCKDKRELETKTNQFRPIVIMSQNNEGKGPIQRRRKSAPLIPKR